MRRAGRILVGLLGVTASLALRVPCTFAAEIPVTRTEQEARLTDIQAQMKEKQRDLFRARMSQDEAEIKRVSKEFRTLQIEEQQLLRATGQMPANP